MISPLIRAASTGDALKVKTLRGVTLASAPVLGLRPTRSRFERTWNLPKDRSFTGSPLTRATNLLEKRIEHLFGLHARQARAAAVNGFLQCGSRQGARILAFSSHAVRDNLLVLPGVTRKEAAGNASGPSLGGVPKEE